ncbi:hypothetical protein U1Q18_024061 [Sarracenia purpurea var. burkii]
MEWTRGATIGRGSSATVSLATAASGDLFAVKSADLSRSAFLQREQHFLSQLTSPHIVKYLGFQITLEEPNNPTYNLYMELVAGGTLSDAIKRERGGSFNESTIRTYTKQILKGLDYLQSNGLVHCDIKGENVLIGKDGLKIADFGCSRLAEEDGGAVTFSGTPVFMAPEVARGEEQGFPADIWALGCTVIEMATGSNNPWPEVNDPVSALYRIGFSGDVPEFPNWLSENAKDFLSKCLVRDSKERWTANQLLHHSFLADEESNSQKVDDFANTSPTSALDQAFWESMEVGEGRRNLTHMGLSSESPSERIRRLIGGTTSSPDSNFPDWIMDADWVTIRSYEIEENWIMNQDDTETYMIPQVNLEEEQENSIVDYEELVSDGSVQLIWIIECLGIWKLINLVMPCQCVGNDFFMRILSLDLGINESNILVQYESSFNPCSLSLIWLG